jgi:hypothetical protein
VADARTAATASGATSGILGRASPRTLAIVCGIALLLIAVGPYVLPTYLVNGLIRAFLYAAVAYPGLKPAWVNIRPAA